MGSAKYNGNYYPLPNATNAPPYFFPKIVQAQLEAAGAVIIGSPAHQISCENAKMWIEETLLSVVDIQAPTAGFSGSVLSG